MRAFVFLLILVLISISGYAQEKYFHELRGLEDSTGVTHLFYRVMDLESQFEYTNHIYHYDDERFVDSLFLKDETIENGESGFDNFYTYDGV